jgi:hypothetical protein
MQPTMGRHNTCTHVLMQSPTECSAWSAGPIQAETLPTQHPQYHDQLDLQQYYGQLAVTMPSTTPHLAWTTWTNSHSTPTRFASPGSHWMGPILWWANRQGMAMTSCSILQDSAARLVIFHWSINVLSDQGAMEIVHSHMETMEYWTCTPRHTDNVISLECWHQKETATEKAENIYENTIC